MDAASWFCTGMFFRKGPRKDWGRDIASSFSPVARFLMSCVSSLAYPIFSYLLGCLRTLVVFDSIMTVVQLRVLYSGEWEDNCV